MGAFAVPFTAGLNVAAANIAKAYRNNALVGDMLAPRVSMDRETFQYVVHDRAALRVEGSDLRAPGNAPRSIRSSFSTDTYFCKSHALQAEIPFESEQTGLGFGFSQIQKATRTVMDKLLLGREALIAATVAGAGTTLALSGTTMWDNAASTPFENFIAARATIRQSGVEANVAILGDPVADALLANTELRDRAKYTAKNGVLDMDILSTMLGIKCVRASAIQVDKSNAVSFVWGQNAVLAYVQDVTSQEDLSALKTFTWSAAPDTVDGYGVIVEPKYPLSTKTTLVSTDWYYDVKITAPETLYTFTNCCAAPTYVSLAAPAVGY